MRYYIQEFLGTFFLIFIGVGSIILNDIEGNMSNLFIGLIIWFNCNGNRFIYLDTSLVLHIILRLQYILDKWQI